MKISDKDVASQLRSRNEKALYYVIDEYGGLMMSIIRKHFHNSDEHEECMHDILLSVWNNIDKFNEDKNTFKNWLAAVSKYKSIDYQRKYHTRINRIDQRGNELDNIYKSNQNADNNGISEELEEMLSQLSDNDKSLFLKRYFYEQSVDQIALDLGVKHSWIHNRLSRGRKKLRSLYSGLKKN